MNYSIRNINSLAKRTVRPKVFAASMVGLSRSAATDEITVAITLCDPRGGVGEGQRMHLTFSGKDANDSLMTSFLGYMVSKLTPEMYEQFDRARREAAAKREEPRP